VRRGPLLRAPFSPAHSSPTRNRVAGWADQLLLRASTEHILIVRGLRARKLAARLAHLRRTEIIFPIITSFTPFRLAVRRGPLLRASNEGLPRPRVARAQRPTPPSRNSLLIATRSPHILFLAGIDSRSSCRPDSIATILTHETTP